LPIDVPEDLSYSSPLSTCLRLRHAEEQLVAMHENLAAILRFCWMTCDAVCGRDPDFLDSVAAVLVQVAGRRGRSRRRWRRATARLDSW
jgi:hypothetical protein